MKKTIFLFISLVVNLSLPGLAQTITTVAGIGQAGYSGDGGAATKARLYYPAGLVVDEEGDVFVADEHNNCIREIGVDGIITTVAGTGAKGYTGDGGPATKATLNQPTSVALDSKGNLYIADYENHCIRKVNKAGIISTFAGSGYDGFYGDGQVVDSADFSSPAGIAIDENDNIYIADQGNNRIRKIIKTGTIKSYAGNGNFGNTGDGHAATSANLSKPVSLAVDAAGNVYFTDAIFSVIRKIDKKGIITRVAGNESPEYSGDGGMATAAGLEMPWGIALDGSGNLYIADQTNARVRKVDKNGFITTCAGTGIAGNSGDGGEAKDTRLTNPGYLAIDFSGNLYISDRGANCIRKVTPSSLKQKKHVYRLLPDPDQDFIEIVRAGDQDIQAEVNITSSTGKLVLSSALKFVRGKTQISTTSITSGMYTIEITDSRGNDESYRISVDK